MDGVLGCCAHRCPRKAAQAPSATCVPFKVRIYFRTPTPPCPQDGLAIAAQTATPTPYSAAQPPNYRSQLVPRPKDGLSIARATLPYHPTTLNLRMPSVARVSLADCFALWGKCTGGLKTPGYSKTVLRTETQRLRRILLSINVCRSACNQAGYAYISQQPGASRCSALFCCRHGQPSSRRNPRTYICQHMFPPPIAAPSVGRSRNSRTDRNPAPYSEAQPPNPRSQLQPRPKNSLAIAGKFRPPDSCLKGKPV